MIKKMRGEEEKKGKEKKKYVSYAFSIKRQIPCMIGGENEHNLIPFYEGGRDAREREKHNEAEGGGKREGKKTPSLPPESGEKSGGDEIWGRM